MPGPAVRVCPSCRVPEIVGPDRSSGGAATTTAVCAEVAEALPAEFLAVTSTRTVLPTSAFVSLYVLEVAPVIWVQLDPVLSQPSHV